MSRNAGSFADISLRLPTVIVSFAFSTITIFFQLAFRPKISSAPTIPNRTEFVMGIIAGIDTSKNIVYNGMGKTGKPHNPLLNISTLNLAPMVGDQETSFLAQMTLRVKWFSEISDIRQRNRLRKRTVSDVGWETPSDQPYKNETLHRPYHKLSGFL